jgi:hypothetical protein
MDRRHGTEIRATSDAKYHHAHDHSTSSCPSLNTLPVSESLVLHDGGATISFPFYLAH